ncbi:MAG: RecX family transcriptional regulator [Oscillospiraceae bacterium]|nr:RecX family transcriptional regulator [Oscillospiraceae bacterium]
MKLEKIEATATHDRVKLCMEDGSSLRVPTTVAEDLGLRAGLELDDDDLSRIREAAGKASAKLRAVRIVAASGVSKQELRRRLRQKGESQENADEAVQWLESLKLLDDREAARRIVERGVARGYGKARIRQMLYEKGVGRELWDEALAAMPRMDDAIDRYLSAHLGRREPDRKELKKITDALFRRGYGWEEIRAALARRQVSLEDEV